MKKNFLMFTGLVVVAVLLILTLTLLIKNIFTSPEKTYLEINSEPKNAIIYLNDKKLEKTTPTKLALKKQYYFLRIEKEGYFPYTTLIDLTKNTNQKIDIKLEEIENNSSKEQEYQKQANELNEYEKSEEQYRQELEKLYKEQPLTKYLPYGGENFSIYYSLQEKHYIIEIPLDYNNEKEKYTKAVKDAYNWMKTKGIDPNQLNIKIKDLTLPPEVFKKIWLMG